MATDRHLKEARFGRAPAKRLFALLPWIVAPVLVFGGLENAAHRVIGDDSSAWYGAVQRQAARAHIDFLFVGSSRTARAISAPLFAQRVGRREGRHVRAFNLGMGAATLAVHYLGLRNLFAEYPEQMRGAVVFVEADSGLSLPVRWDGDEWVHPDYPQMIVPLLRWRDLPGLWTSPSTVNQKAGITLRFLSRGSTLLSHRERFREELLWQSRSWLRGIWPAPASAAEPSGARHLAPARLDPRPFAGLPREEARAAAKELAVKIAAQRLHDQKPIETWDGTIQANLARLLRENDASLVFFAMPEKSMFAAGYQTDLRRADRRRFAAAVKSWGGQMLKPTFSFDDEDFPDQLHLRRERVAEFTQALADAWFAAAQGDGAPGGRRGNAGEIQ